MSFCLAVAGLQPSVMQRNPWPRSRPSACTHFARPIFTTLLHPGRFHLKSQPSRRVIVRYGNESDGMGDDSVCLIPVVSVNNDPENKYTELKIEVLDYPGLLRVVSWVLNGMGMRAHNARLITTEDGVAEDTFWLTDYSGRKLSDRSAESLAERIQDYILKCKPETDHEDAQIHEYQCGNVFVSNNQHDKCTVITIKGEPEKQGFLLDVASLITGIGLQISEAVIKGEEGDHQEDYDFKEGRLFRFWVTDSDKRKLDYTRISALIYTLRLVVGKGQAPTTPPNLDILAQIKAGNGAYSKGR